MFRRRQFVLDFMQIRNGCLTICFMLDYALGQSATTLIPPENLLELLTINSALHAIKQSRSTTTEKPVTSTLKAGVLSGIPIPTLWPVLPESPSASAKDSSKKQLPQLTTTSGPLGYQQYNYDPAVFHNDIYTGLIPIQIQQPFRYYLGSSGNQLYDDVIQQQQLQIPLSQGSPGQSIIYPTGNTNGQRQDLYAYSPQNYPAGNNVVQGNQLPGPPYYTSSLNNNRPLASAFINDVQSQVPYFLKQTSSESSGPTEPRFPQPSTGLQIQQTQQVNSQGNQGFMQSPLNQANIYNLMPSETYLNQQRTALGPVSSSRWNEGRPPVSYTEQQQYNTQAKAPIYEDVKSGIYGYGAQPGFAAIGNTFSSSNEASNNIQSQFNSFNGPYPGCHR